MVTYEGYNKNPINVLYALAMEAMMMCVVTIIGFAITIYEKKKMKCFLLFSLLFAVGLADEFKLGRFRVISGPIVHANASTLPIVMTDEEKLIAPDVIPSMQKDLYKKSHGFSQPQGPSMIAVSFFFFHFSRINP